MENRRQKGNLDIGQTRRVKVSRMVEGKWDDHGTGHITVDYMERSEDLGLSVYAEEDNEILLLHRIGPDDIYRKQEDTIISWRDPACSTELALSFQESAGCSYIWDQICNAQRNLHFGTLNPEVMFIGGATAVLSDKVRVHCERLRFSGEGISEMIKISSCSIT